MLSKADWDKMASDGVLNSKPDRELARELGCCHTTVGKNRRLRNLPPFTAMHAAPAPDWSAWPTGALNEIARCLANNDNPPTNWGFIPARKMVDRLQEHWGADNATLDLLVRYCRSVGRRGWRYK